MAQSVTGAAAALLRRASLLATLLAIVAGLLGMHVLAGSHGAHGATAAVPAAASSAGDQRTTAAAGHGGHAAHSAHGTLAGETSPDTAAPATSASAPAAESAAQLPPSCSCQGSCGEISAAHASCVPAAGGASLSAPPPGTTPVAVPDVDAGRHQAVAAYDYVPGSPSPGELSISRT